MPYQHNRYHSLKVLFLVSGNDFQIIPYVQALTKGLPHPVICCSRHIMYRNMKRWANNIYYLPNLYAAWINHQLNKLPYRFLRHLISKYNIDLIHCLSEEENDLCAMAAINISKRYKRRLSVIYEPRRPWCLTRGEVAGIHENAGLEQFAYENSAGHIFPTEAVRQYFFEHYLHDSRKNLILGAKGIANFFSFMKSDQRKAIPMLNSQKKRRWTVLICDIPNQTLFVDFKKLVLALVYHIPQCTFHTHIGQNHPRGPTICGRLSRQLGKIHYKNFPERAGKPVTWEYDFALSLFPLWGRDKEREWHKRVITPEAAVALCHGRLPIITVAQQRGLKELIATSGAGHIIDGWKSLRGLLENERLCYAMRSAAQTYSQTVYDPSGIYDFYRQVVVP